MGSTTNGADGGGLNDAVSGSDRGDVGPPADRPTPADHDLPLDVVATDAMNMAIDAATDSAGDALPDAGTSDPTCLSLSPPGAIAGTGTIESWLSQGAGGAAGAGGGATSVPVSTTCSAQGWCTELPQPFGDPFAEASAIWGPSPDLVLVLFPEDIYVWNGAGWQIASLPPMPFVASGPTRGLRALHGSSARDIWAVGSQALHFDGCRWSNTDTGMTNPLTAVWSIAPDDAWAADGAGHLLHWGGSSWTVVSPSPVPTGMSITGLWGSGSKDVWAVSAGILLHWDGTAWRTPANSFGIVGGGVWGSDPQNVWVFGGAIYRWDGAAWATQAPTNINFDAPAYPGWGTGPTDVWTVSRHRSGVLWHYNGQTWEPYAVGPSQLNVVWSPRPRDVWTTTGSIGFSTSQAVMHGDGVTFRSVRRSPAGTSYMDVQRLSSSAVWALAGDGLVLFDGSRWSGVAGPPDALSLSALRVNGPEDLWVGGTTADGVAAFHRTSAGWATFPIGGREPITQIWTTDGDVWLISGELRSNAIPAPLRQASGVKQLWGASRNDIWSVGPSGVGHFNGTEWRTQALGALSSISGIAAADIYVVGEGGLIVHWDGTTWTPMPSGLTANLSTVLAVAKDDVWAFGRAVNGNAVALHWDGQAWTPRATGFSGLGAAGQAGTSQRGTGISFGGTWVVRNGTLFRYRGQP